MRGKNGVGLLTASLLGASLLACSPSATGETTATSNKTASLADGDQFTVSVSRDLKTVWGRRFDAATGTWGQRRVVFREEGIYCGDAEARTAGEAVAVIAECDEGGWSEDQAPTHSQALYSPDTMSWQAFTLPGEAYEEPGISPSGTHAVWPLYAGWATYGPDGFKLVQRELPGQEYTITGAITDSGDVSILYGASRDSGRDCALAVLTVTGNGAESTQDLEVDDACADVALTNVDALTVRLGDGDYPESIVTISRPDTASPWTATGAPEDAPGLVRYRGKGTATTLFPHSPGLPLLAVGSPDLKTFLAQSFDPESQSWTQPVAIRSASARCTWGDNFIREPLGVFALRLTCGDVRRVLVSVDGVDWDDARLRRTPMGVSPDGSEVSVSSRKRTRIYSRERGKVELPVGSSGRCDVVQPVSPTAAIRLTSTDERGWPSRLDRSTARGWKRTATTFPPLRVGTDRCADVEPEFYTRPLGYAFHGRTRAVTLSVVPQGDTFRITKRIY